MVILAAGFFALDFWLNGSSKIKNNQLTGFLDYKKKLPPAGEEVSLIAVGDISYSRGVERTVKKNNDINYPLLKTRDYLNKADFAFGNLETPITAGREINTGEMIFRSNPGTEKVLMEAGFKILSLANNHTPNFGESGLKDTFKYLEQAGIGFVGAGSNGRAANQPAFIEVKGVKFAFLAYNSPDVVPESYEASDNRAGTAFMNTEAMVKAVREAKPKVDFVIISMHAGVEYANQPNNFQINFARLAIDAGADLIIGHHPHVVQTMEKYKGKYIFYSLGNFIFDQPFSEETKEGLAVKIYFTKKEISKIYLTPVIMEKFTQPRLAAGLEAQKILTRLEFPLAERKIYFWDSKKNIYSPSQSKFIGNDYFNVARRMAKTESADLDNNLSQEIYILENGRLTVTENSKKVWQSPGDWWVDNFLLSDSTNDGTVDLNLSVWKAGNFGSSKPFWVKENDQSVKNHFFVFNFKAGRVTPLWQSSNLEKPNKEIAIADINGDNKNDLVAIEGNYEDEKNCEENYIAVWQWNGWGFSNEWRSDKGNFCDLMVENIDYKNYITAESK